MIDMSGWNPQIADWMSRGLDWQYINQSTLRPFDIPAGEQLQLPRGAYTFNYPEGVLLQFSAFFDHPSCGVRIEANPNFDTRTDFTINTISLGLTRPEILVFTSIPPVTLPGQYTIRIVSPWNWKKWLKLYVINTDTIPHRCFGHGYNLVVLRDPREKPVEGDE